MKTTARFDALPPYPLAEMKALRRTLEAEGVDIIDLGAGDAAIDPPPIVVETLREVASDLAHSRYSFQAGLPAYRQAIVRFMERRFDVAVDSTREVVPLIGSKDGLAHLPFAFIGEGDVAVIPDPGYQAYLGSVTLAGGVPHLVPLRPENDFLIPLDEIPSDVVAKTRILYLNYPNNPTTAVAPDAYVQEAIAFCRGHDIVLAYDIAYSEFGFNGYKPRSILEFDGARDVAIEFHSLSKTYNMTGWRIGWAVGGAELIGALAKVKTFVDTGPYLGIQAAAAAALDSGEEWVRQNIDTFRRRRDAAVQALNAAGFAVESPQATMYVWVPVPGTESSEAFAHRLLEEEGVIVLPGAALGSGGEGFVRIALTVDEDRLAEAATRMGRARAGR
ncbi:MAG: aminotransferase class I/II-fold pyridoxal phosphate-dependent enzyme [Gemmatimonadota bacterium]